MTEPEKSRFADVAVTLPVPGTYTYDLTPDLSEKAVSGMRVIVPFGNRRVTGYILGKAEHTELKEVKSIIDMPDEGPMFPEEMIDFFRWIANYYLVPIGEVIHTALPGGLTARDVPVFSLQPPGRHALENGRAEPGEISVLNALSDGPKSLRAIRGGLGSVCSPALMASLVERRWVARERRFKAAAVREKTERTVSAADTEGSRPLTAARRSVLAVLSDGGEMSLKELLERSGRSRQLIRAMADDGQIRIREKAVYRDPFGDRIRPDRAHRLNREQQQVVGEVISARKAGFTPYLLRGVTGSGKTEVYLHLSREIVSGGDTVLVLVPEIALISQMERRFRARFGDCIAVLHSGLSAGERFDQWLRILRRQARIVIGARSALFAPLTRIGLVVVDEEHDTSYKQESGVRYHARDLALVRAKLARCPAVLGSATPSVESAYNARQRKYVPLELPRRVKARSLPDVVTVDLRDSRDLKGPQRFLTPTLTEAIEHTLERGEQALLFLNRRGYASYPVCNHCGESLRCRHCDITLTLHREANAYRCHYCGYSRPAVPECPACNSASVIQLGLGTEKIEAAVSAMFPSAAVERMDGDTTTRKGSVVRMLKRLRDRRTDILIGTQMVAKGHDFPNITLVGVICADLSLNFPDFRSGERTFQLMAQVAGRAGRGDRHGRVILQTYNPDHFCISSAREQNYDTFYRQEIAGRQALQYPPFTRLLQLRISGRSREATRRHAIALGDACRHGLSRLRSGADRVHLMGPIASPVPRIAGRYRWQMLLKAPQAGAIHRFVRAVMHEAPGLFQHRDIRVVLDMDPVSLM